VARPSTLNVGSLNMSQGTSLHASLIRPNSSAFHRLTVSIPGLYYVPLLPRGRTPVIKRSTTRALDLTKCVVACTGAAIFSGPTGNNTPRELLDPSSHTSTCSVDHRSSVHNAGSHKNLSAFRPRVIGIHRFPCGCALFFSRTEAIVYPARKMPLSLAYDIIVLSCSSTSLGLLAWHSDVRESNRGMLHEHGSTAKYNSLQRSNQHDVRSQTPAGRTYQ
jgi:hypothetical protein